MVLELLYDSVPMILKIFVVVEVDEVEYVVPADGRIDEEVNVALSEYLYDIDGLTVQSIKIVSE